ncbi:aromatase/cyclase [Streptomyces sp. NPDC091266]|uniref:aromatase/cyclase n=1 Tax=Streptomyces sp. NPDC091266 TaxID=3365978 RepID=UPI0037FFE681
MADAHGWVAKTAHEVTVAAPPDLVYRLLADLANWPWIFRPFVHAERLGADGPFDRVGMWTTTGDQVEHWVALRRLDEARLRVDFRPEEPAAPPAMMERSWIVEPRSGGSSTVRLLHRYSVLGGDPSALESTARVIDTIADAETQAVKRAAELVAGTPELKVEVTERPRTRQGAGSGHSRPDPRRHRRRRRRHHAARTTPHHPQHHHRDTGNIRSSGTIRRLGNPGLRRSPGEQVGPVARRRRCWGP